MQLCERNEKTCSVRSHARVEKTFIERGCIVEKTDTGDSESDSHLSSWFIVLGRYRVLSLYRMEELQNKEYEIRIVSIIYQ
jgi:hypothetical protein